MIEFEEAKKGDIVVYCPQHDTLNPAALEPEEVTIRDITINRNTLIYTVTNWFTGQSWDTSGDELHLPENSAKFYGRYYQLLVAEGDLQKDMKKRIKQFRKKFPEYSF